MKYTILFLLLLIAAGCCPYKYVPMCDPPPPAPFRVPEKVRVALVLGSGGVRGMAHVGVIEELVRAGIDIDVIIGCSAGSIVGALYADSKDICRVRHAVQNLKTDSILDINLWECRFGLSQGTAIKKMLRCNLWSRYFEQLQIPLVVVAADLHQGCLVPIGSGDLIKAVRASTAIPLVFVPEEIDGRILVDGGTINPVPVCVARDLGADLIIAVDLCELLPQTFPTNLLGVAARSTEIAFMWQNSVCVKHADIIIRPSMCGIGTFNDKALTTLYNVGRAAGREAVPAILERIAQMTPKSPCEGEKYVVLPCYQPVSTKYDGIPDDPDEL